MKKIIYILMFVLLSLNVLAATRLIDSERIDANTNTFLNNQDSRIAMLIPTILISICIICFFIDFGALAVSLSSIMALFIANLLHFVSFSWASGFALLIMMAIVGYKMYQ